MIDPMQSYQGASRRFLTRVNFLDTFESGQWGRYFFGRLKYLFLLQSVAVAIKFLEWKYLQQAYQARQVLSIFVLNSAMSMAVALWWGFLEPFREQMRNLRRSKNQPKIKQVSEQWLRLSVLVALGLGLISMVWLALQQVSGNPLSVLDAYLLVMVLRFGIQAFDRVQVSVLYATQRTYRPIFAVMLLDVSGISGLLLADLYPQTMGWWAFPVSLLVGTLIWLVWTQVLNRTQLGRYGLDLRLISKRKNSLPRVSTQHFWDALSFSSLRAAPLLILAAAAISNELATFFFLATPWINSLSTFVLVFQHDLDRLRSVEFRHQFPIWRKRMHALVLAWGALIATVLSVFKWGMGVSLTVQGIVLIYGLACLRCWSALEQLIAFSFYRQGARKWLVGLSAVFLAVWWTLRSSQASHSATSIQGILMGAAVGFLAMIVILRSARPKSVARVHYSFRLRADEATELSQPFLFSVYSQFDPHVRRKKGLTEISFDRNPYPKLSTPQALVQMQADLKGLPIGLKYNGTQPDARF